MDFAQKLLQLMALRRITQEALGDALGVSHVAVGKWLRGAKPRPIMGQRIATFFGVPPDSLLNDDCGLPDEVTSALFSPAKQEIGERVIEEVAMAYARQHPEQLGAIASSLQHLIAPLHTEIREIRESVARLEHLLSGEDWAKARLQAIREHVRHPGPAGQARGRKKHHG